MWSAWKTIFESVLPLLTRNALEGYGVCEVALTQNFQKEIFCTKHVGPTINILSLRIGNYEFGFLGKGKQIV
jgi:hypothetical protein